MAIFASQPFKGLYIAVAIAFNVLRFPYWLIRYSIPSQRPNPRWTLGQAVQIRIARAYLYTTSIIHVKVAMSLLPGKEGKQWVVLEPADRKYITGVAASDKDISPAVIGGTWYPEPLAKASGLASSGFVVLHVHGGAFVIGDGRKVDSGFTARTILAHTDASHIFCPQYRIATHPGGRFPGNLQDVITSYCYLIFQLGIDPKRIVVSGDSAGGNLVLALLRYIADHGEKLGLPSPACAWLWSPWVNPKRAYYDIKTITESPNEDTDFVTGTFGSWGARMVSPAAHSGLTIDSPYINAVDKPFASRTPMFISVGESEILFHEVSTLYEGMSRIKGNKVEIQVEENAVHDIILVGPIVGFQEEAKKTAKRAGDFLRRVASLNSSKL